MNRHLTKLREILLRYTSMELWKQYLVVAIPFGVAFVLFIPPFQVPDEPVHYFRAQDIAHGNIVCVDMRVFIETDELEFPDIIEHGKVAFHSDVNSDTSKLFEDREVDNDIDGSDKRIATCGASPFGYIASSSGVLLGSLFENELISFYLGRFFNLFLSISLMALAVKLIPIGKRVVFAVGIFPVTLMLFGSFSYDALTISSIALFIAYILHLESKLTIDNKSLLILAALTIVAMSVKISYQPYLLILLTLYRRNSSMREKFYKTVYIISLLFIVGILVLTGIHQSSEIGFYDSRINPSEQVQHILNNPVQFLVILFRLYILNLNGIISSAIGYMGWLDYSIGTLGLWAGNVLIFLALLNPLDLPKRYKVTTILALVSASIITVLLVSIAMYTRWTPVGSDSILGIQGRYLTIPLLAILVSITGIVVIKKKDTFIEFKGNSYSIMFTIFLLILLIKAVLSTIVRYYI